MLQDTYHKDNKKEKPRWDFSALRSSASIWKKERLAKKHAWGEQSPWWRFLFDWNTSINRWIEKLIAGEYVFSPLKTYSFPTEPITLWTCEDRLILALIYQIIKPTFSKIISPLCYHLVEGVGGVQTALDATVNAFQRRSFRYVIRADIKSYYASIDHRILLKQLQENFHDPRLLKYFDDIVTIPIEKDGAIYLHKQGIPCRSSTSPFFGAMYLSPLDRIFEKRQGVFYARYQDDILILCKTKNQFAKAKRAIKNTLAQLKLKLSPDKTKMGELSHFHFLGVNFALTQPSAHTNPQKAVKVHPRTCRRALDKATAMKEDAGHPAHVQQYLSRWALWWRRASKSVLPVGHLLFHLVDRAIAIKNELRWLARGLLLGHLSDQPLAIAI